MDQNIENNEYIYLVSVNVITYNQETYISDALNSILLQKTNFSFEIVVCDDYSTDNTRNILNEYFQKYPKKIRLRYRERNLGLKNNYFDNITACKGKYVAICEGDDYWTDPFKLQKQIDFLENNPEYSMCFHNAIELHELADGSSMKNVFSKLENRDYKGSEILSNWIVPSASVVFVNSDSFSFKYLNDFLFYDIILFLRLAERGKIQCIPEAMSVYRRHAGSITNSSLKYIDYIKHIHALDKEFHLIYHGEVKRLLGIEYFKQFKNRLKQRSALCIIFLFISFWYDYKVVLNKARSKFQIKI